MKHVLEVFLVIAMFAAGMPRTGAQNTKDNESGRNFSPIVGTWIGEKQGSPFVTLNVSQNKNGELSGTAAFFILDRESGHTPPKILGKADVQLLNLKLEGRVFTFSVRNNQGQTIMNPSSGDELRFRMTLESGTIGNLKSDRQDAEAVKMMKK